MDSVPSASSALSETSSDQDLFAAIQLGQVTALDLLYERYGRLVYSVALRVINDAQEAEDITQDTFLRLWQRSEIYQPHWGSLNGFLIMLARSRAIDRLRSRQSHFRNIQQWQLSYEQAATLPSPLESATLKERSHHLREALKQLSKAEREVIETAYYGGLSQSEIARQTGLPLGTVKSRSRQALKKLRTALKSVL